MKENKQENNIVKYRKKRQLNIGLWFFGLIFIYLIATMITTFTAPNVSVYEVRQGSILKDSAYTGVALREEALVYSETEGYINYYAEEQSKVRVGTDVYTISEQKLKFQELNTEEEFMLSNEEFMSFVLKIQSYNNQFQPEMYSSTYQLKEEMQSTLNKQVNQNKTQQLSEMISSGNYPTLTMKRAGKDGIIVYSMDGMEELTPDNFTSDKLGKSNYKKTNFSHNMKVSSGKPIYKLVTSDNWHLIIEVSGDIRMALSDMKTVNVKFKKDNQVLKGNISFLNDANKNILCLSFQDSMVRYITDRFLDVELILEDKSGLKIPKSAKTTKDFYVIPKEYITQGGNNKQDGVMRKQENSKGESITEFLNVTIYYEEDGLVYLDPNAFDKGDILIKPESGELYPLEAKRSLKGVYCINKGYAVFKQIQILCESDEYYIIEEGNSFGLSNYDHIALDSKSTKENEFVY